MHALLRAARLVSLTHARSLTLARSLSRSLCAQGLYKKRVEEIDPTIRYCKYNVSRHGGATDLEEKELLEIGSAPAPICVIPRAVQVREH